MESVVTPFIWGLTGNPRQTWSMKTVVQCLLNDLPTAGGLWKFICHGKLAPGSLPVDTPSGTIVFTGVFLLSFLLYSLIHMQ